jgi:hypothetical protein
MKQMHGLTSGGRMPVAAIEAYAHGQTIKARPIETEAHAVKQHGGKPHLPSAIPIGKSNGFVRTHRTISFDGLQDGARPRTVFIGRVIR